MWKVLVLLLMGGVLLGGCAGNARKDHTNFSANELYNQGVDKLKAKKFKEAVESFEEIELNYPTSEFARNGSVMQAYGYYSIEKYEDAIIILERFLKFNPNSKNTPYALYLKGLCNYERIADIGRDQEITILALKDFKELVSKFPQTDYAKDAKIKIDFINNQLAGKEMEIGRFYLKNHYYIGAANRFQQVLRNYQTSSQIQEALHRLVECYLALGIKEEAIKYAAVLGHNYPASKWYKYSYKLINK